ncbi:MAG: CysB family HTH-type transcriptional regulator [Gammaproteobacteria bacterium]|nr:CysB family HTH-type transcriptional regulator [Gammaproteobacteria bacterium]
MNLTQLRHIDAIVKNAYNLSRAAETLHTTQPGVSTQLRALEDELGVMIFERKGKRIIGLTAAGESIVSMSQEILQKIRAIRAVGEEFSQEKKGTFTIATTHTQARYALPAIITRFVKRYPDVQLRIRQGHPQQISEMVIQGDADIAIATEAIASYQQLLMLPVYRWNRCLIARSGHPVLKPRKPTLDLIAQFPIVTYDFAFAGRSAMNKSFIEAGLKPNIVLTAIDSDVIKHYVELGLGIGVLAHMAYDEKRDKKLRCKDVSHLFDDSVTSIGIRRGSFLRGYMLEFVEMFAPHLSIGQISSLLTKHSPELENELMQKLTDLPLR